MGAARKAVVYQWEARKRTPSPVFWQRLTTLVLFYKFDDEREKAQAGAPDQPASSPEGKAERESARPSMVRCYAVFNVEQADGLKLERKGDDRENEPEWKAHQTAERATRSGSTIDSATRDRLSCPSFGLYVHWFQTSDDDCLHDHPWPFLTIILRGGYWEGTPGPGRDRVTVSRWHGPGSVHVRPARWLHRIAIDPARKPVTLVRRGLVGRAD